MTAEVSGIDVSEFQGVVDWPTVAASGVRVVVARATYGTTYVDHQWARNWPALATLSSVTRGVYHFATPSGGTPTALAADAQQQAAFFLATLNAAGGWRRGDLAPVLDLEVTGGLTAASLQYWAAHWLDDIAAALPSDAPPPFIYTDQNFWQTYLAPLAGRGVPLWVAAYGSTPTVVHIAHQYTDALTVPGITGNVDGDHWDVSALPAATAPAAPGVIWTPRPGGIAWSFTPPAAATGYTGWRQGTDAEPAPTTPAFTTDGGYWQWRWAPPGSTALILTFFFGRETATVRYPIPLAANAVVAATAAVSADVATLQTHVAALSSAAATLQGGASS